MEWREDSEENVSSSTGTIYHFKAYQLWCINHQLPSFLIRLLDKYILRCPPQSSTGTRRTKNLQDFGRLFSQTAPLVAILTAVSLSLFKKINTSRKQPYEERRNSSSQRWTLMNVSFHPPKYKIMILVFPKGLLLYEKHRKRGSGRFILQEFYTNT